MARRRPVGKGAGKGAGRSRKGIGRGVGRNIGKGVGKGAAPSLAWQRRNQLAREKGYASYYDYRAHEYGKLPPSAPRPTGARLRRLRGHASLADLIHDIRHASLVIPLGHERDGATGQFKRIEVVVYDDEGDSRHYQLRGKVLRSDQLDRLVEALDAAGVAYMASPSLDIRRSSDTISDEPDEDVELEEETG